MVTLARQAAFPHYRPSYLHTISDAELDARIDAERIKAEWAAVAMFRWLIIGTLPFPFCQRRYGRTNWGRTEAQRHCCNFWNRQNVLKILWAERCRRDGVPYDPAIGISAEKGWDGPRCGRRGYAARIAED